MGHCEISLRHFGDWWAKLFIRIEKWTNTRLLLGNLLVDQATMSDGRVVDRARAWCSTVGVPYFRFNPQMSVDIPMDEKLDAPLVNMLWETKAYMYAHRNKVIEMINLLK